jgi:hypothetical protein
MISKVFLALQNSSYVGDTSGFIPNTIISTYCMVLTKKPVPT